MVCLSFALPDEVAEADPLKFSVEDVMPSLGKHPEKKHMKISLEKIFLNFEHLLTANLNDKHWITIYP